MIEVGQEKVEKLRASLDVALKDHSDTTYRKDPANNFQYSRDVRLRALALQQLIETGRTEEGESEITGVAISRIKNLKTIVEIVFGEKIPEEQEGVQSEYTPTVFEGIYGRTELLSVHAMHGSMVSLDFAAEDSM
jgi:hypothetical protein